MRREMSANDPNARLDIRGRLPQATTWRLAKSVRVTSNAIDRRHATKLTGWISSDYRRVGRGPELSKSWVTTISGPLTQDAAA